MRHEQWQQIIKDDEDWWDKKQNPDGSSDPTTSGDWDSSKSAVLGLATNYGLGVYERTLHFFLFHVPLEINASHS